jgi:hypothetical protein
LRDHQEKLGHAFNRLRVHNLKLQPEKCAFHRKEVLFLGHLINSEGVSPDPKKILKLILTSQIKLQTISKEKVMNSMQLRKRLYLM